MCDFLLIFMKLHCVFPELALETSPFEMVALPEIRNIQICLRISHTVAALVLWSFLKLYFCCV